MYLPLSILLVYLSLSSTLFLFSVFLSIGQTIKKVTQNTIIDKVVIFVFSSLQLFCCLFLLQ